MNQRQLSDTEVPEFHLASENVLYVKMNGYIYYLDDSTGEQIMECWKNRCESCEQGESL